MRTYELDMRGLFGAMIVLSALLLFSGPDAFAYDEGGRENAVRVAEFSNSPSAQFLLMALNRSFESAEKRPSLWRSLPSETEADRANLKVVGESGDYDIWFSSDGSIVRNAFGQGLLKSFSPVFEEEIILAGPIGSSEFSGMSALDAMKKIFSENLPFFSLLRNEWAVRTELSLWKNAGIMNPEGNRQYVESSRDDVTALFQAGEEKAFVLIGEASFAQYSNTMQTPELEKIAGTGEYKSCFLCVVKGSAFKRARAEAAEGFAVWFSGNEAREIIRSFDIGGLKPFRPVPPLK